MNLTCMLVLTTIFIDVSNNLPKTSYMKMIDVWLLFTLLQPFIVVLLHTYMDSLREEDDGVGQISKLQGKNTKKLDSVRRFAIVTNPVGVLIFVTLYWIVGFYHAGIFS